jgi:hypothetical protein
LDVSLPTSIGVDGCALEEDGGSAVEEGAVHHVAVTCYPANVGDTAKHVTRLVVKH